MQSIPHLDRKGLRQFGLMMAGFVAVVFGLALPWLWGYRYPVWPWIVGVVISCWALVAPVSLRPFYRGWMRIALVIGGIVNRLMLGIVYYGVVLPTGLIMRLRGRDPMRRQWDVQAKTYRIPSETRHREHMRRPF